MSLIASPRPVHSKAAVQLPGGVRFATACKPSRQVKANKGLRATDQDLREIGQDLRESGQNMRESDQALRDAGADSRETAQDNRQTGQDLQESEQVLREISQNTRESEQALRESDQDLRESNLALLESNEWFRLLVESVTDYAIYMLDPEGRVVTWNAGAERSNGYKAEEAMGRNYSIFFLSEDVEAGIPVQDLATAAREGRYETEAWRLRKDGSRFWALITLTAIRGANGELRGFAKVTRDRSEQRAADEALQSRNAQLERYRIIVENVSDYVFFTLDTEGRIDSWSSGARNVLGYTAEEALGREYSLVFTPAEILAGEPRREMETAARRGSCPADSWRVRRDGSQFWASGVLTAVRDEAGKLTGYIRVARDMTQQKRLEESLAKMAANLELRVTSRTHELETTVAELQRKNKEIEAFVYIVSHDLRAPLVNVQGFVHELEGSCKHLKEVIQQFPQWEQVWPAVQQVLDKDMGGALHYIAASATKFERLIEALLGLSRHGRQVYQLALVNIPELVSNAVATFQQEMIEAGAVIDVGALPSVTADATALGQVFSNLIGNALKYRNPERPLKVELGGRVEDGMVHYFVRDNGLGIPEYGMAKLFQVFQRFHAQQAEGEGMGLAIAHRIVERHGGKIWAESREGEGTTFHFSLPVNPGSTTNVT